MFLKKGTVLIMALTILRAGDILISQTGWYDLRIAYTTQNTHTVLMRIYRYTSGSGRQLVYDRRVSCHAGNKQVSGDFFYLESTQAFQNLGGNYNYQVNIEFDDAKDYGPQGAPGPSNARTIDFYVTTSITVPVIRSGVEMVVVPHFDDEMIMFYKTIKTLVEQNRAVKIVFLTDGAGGGVEQNLAAFTSRAKNAIKALSAIGVQRQNLVFLGYRDFQTLKSAFYSTNQHTSFPASPHNKTCGNKEEGLFEYHFLKNQVSADCTKFNIMQNLEELITLYKPTNIYTTSRFEDNMPNVSNGHPDHHATFEFLYSIKKTKPALNFILHHSLIYAIWGPPFSPDTYGWAQNYNTYNINNSPFIQGQLYNHSDHANLELKKKWFKDDDSSLGKWKVVKLTESNRQEKQRLIETSDGYSVGYGYFAKTNEFYWTIS
jgi:LmbE family N-acetylglucosaminyl deacetylase